MSSTSTEYKAFLKRAKKVRDELRADRMRPQTAEEARWLAKQKANFIDRFEKREAAKTPKKTTILGKLKKLMTKKKLPTPHELTTVGGRKYRKKTRKYRSSRR